MNSINTPRRLLLASALLAAGMLLPQFANAQGTYPNRPIKFVVPYAAGGLPDTVARIFAQRLG
ncbi:MAG: tripartite tricarboxylate transporter substrate binding protein, partial [Polaromonas sp.]|nr:tripartite tricarboxylate transporter substrate binding protein [Polaromonas sp.]